MVKARFVAVIDIGKTNAKLAIVDRLKQTEIAVRKIENISLVGPLYLHFDIQGIWEFLCASLAELNAEIPIDAISCTTHGACAALVDDLGNLALPVLDYEYSGPEQCDTYYRRVRPDFSESSTPPLSGGLNLAKQLVWQAREFPDEFARTKWILLYPQYWGFLLTGIAASEITSIGCHSDLWNFPAREFSSLVKNQGWEEKFPPLRKAQDILGPVQPQLAEQLGLRQNLPVYVGIHDSNASLLPHLLSKKSPFAVVSTGTWVVVCAPGGSLENLDPSRDSFSNIDVFGRQVPSARFMGGREFSKLTGNVIFEPHLQIIEQVLKNKWMLLPSVCKGSGPFPTHNARLSVARENLSPEAHYTIVCFYLALMTAECLILAGASGETIVEGPFATNTLFLEMLKAATARPVRGHVSNSTGTSIGAALLAASPGGRTAPILQDTATPMFLSKMSAYASAWRKAIEQIPAL